MNKFFRPTFSGHGGVGEFQPGLNRRPHHLSIREIWGYWIKK